MTLVWSIGKSDRIIKLSKETDSPGPCAYNPPIRLKTPSWTMHGTNSRGFTIVDKGPGPGAYDLKRNE